MRKWSQIKKKNLSLQSRDTELRSYMLHAQGNWVQVFWRPCTTARAQVPQLRSIVNNINFFKGKVCVNVILCCFWKTRLLWVALSIGLYHFPMEHYCVFLIYFLSSVYAQHSRCWMNPSQYQGGSIINNRPSASCLPSPKPISKNTVLWDWLCWETVTMGCCRGAPERCRCECWVSHRKPGQERWRTLWRGHCWMNAQQIAWSVHCKPASEF